MSSVFLRSFPSRCSGFWVSTSPPPLRTTAQTPRPARRNASSANRRLELRHVTPHVAPPILKSADWRRRSEDVCIWKKKKEMYINCKWSNEKERILWWRLLLLLVRGRGRCLSSFLLTYRVCLKTFEHYSRTCCAVFFCFFTCVHDRSSSVYTSCVSAAFPLPSVLLLKLLFKNYLTTVSVPSLAVYFQLLRLVYIFSPTVPEKGRRRWRMNSLAAPR